MGNQCIALRKLIERACSPVRWILFITVFLPSCFALAQVSPVTAIEQANRVLWEKFIDKYGIVNDYVGERPTPFDCRLSRPNTFGWWTPIEDGAFFTGLYLKAACERAKSTNNDLDKDKARVLAQGLLKLASISDVPGFIARGVATDGRAHYSVGSNDQTVPWFFGLYTYLKTDIPSPREREIITSKMIEVINSLRLNSWRFPSDGLFTQVYWDDLKANRFLEVANYLFLLRAMNELTQEEGWLKLYRVALRELPEGASKTREEICSVGIKYDVEMWEDRRDYLWIYVMKQASLVELTRMEDSQVSKKYFIEGIRANRDFVMDFIKEYAKFDNNDTQVFGNVNWRDCYPDWFPHFTIDESKELSQKGVTGKIGTRKKYERVYMTTPLAAASIISLAGNEADCELIKKVISHYDYSMPYLSEFFYAEFAYYLRPCTNESND